MRILFLTDPHYRGMNPRSRKDDYHKAIRGKLLYVGKLCKKYKPTCVLLGGDLFHVPNPAFSLVVEMLKILWSWEVPVYTVLGSHDQFGYSKTTLPRTAMGVLQAAGALRILGHVYLRRYNVELVGVSHSVGLDRTPVLYCKQRKKEGSILIEVAHGMLVPKPFFGEYTLLKDVDTEAAFLFCGHYHPGWKTCKIGHTTFVNPGSLGRVSNVDRVYPPSVVIAEVTAEGYKQKVIPVPSQDVEDVFDEHMIPLNRSEEGLSEQLGTFLESLSTKVGQLETADLKQLVLDIGRRRKVNKVVLKHAVSFLEQARIKEV